MKSLIQGVQKLVMFLVFISVIQVASASADPANQDDEKQKKLLFLPNTYTNHVSADIRTGPAGNQGIDVKAGQAAAAAFWKSVKASNQPIDQAVVIQLYQKAGHFSNIHALLEAGIISPADSKAIGDQRARLHRQALDNMVKSGKFGSKIGINDFGSGEMSAKSDIDFTLYPGMDGVDGAMLVAGYREQFMRLTGGIDPGAFDLVAHRFEATVPDWRQAGSSSEFAAKLRTGTSLLRQNHEAYFLEGAYVNQIIARSMDPERKTFTWVKKSGQTTVHESMNVVESNLPYFYHRDSRQRNAFGSAVGNWHFFHAHADDPVAMPKYLLRSVDGVKPQFGDHYIHGDFSDMPARERAVLVEKMYGHMAKGLAPEARKLKLRTIQAALETAVLIRERKAKGVTSLDAEAYRPLIDLERSIWPKSVPVSDEQLTAIAKSHVKRYWPAILVENNIHASKGRLADWRIPPIKPGMKYTTIDKNGKATTLDVDAGMVKRYQYAAFFELKDGISLMGEDQIRRIIPKNDSLAERDFRILSEIFLAQQLPETPRPSLPGDLETRLKEYRQAGDAALGVLGRMGIKVPGMHTWNKARIVEDFLQERAVDSLFMAGMQHHLPALYQFREDVKAYNNGLVNPNLLMAADYGTSLIKVLDAMVVNGRFSPEVLQVMSMELVSRIPVFGALMNASMNPSGTAIDLVSSQLIPGYGPLKLGIQLGVETVRLGGHIIFVPLQEDKLLMAYQGYLDPEEWGLFSSGQKERVNSPRAPLLYPMDPAMKLGMDERRLKVHEYFYDRVVRQTINKDPDFIENEALVAEFFEEARKNPGDIQARNAARGAARAFGVQERLVLGRKIKEFVNHWWNATGPFAEFDELLVRNTAAMPERAFLGRLQAMLISDYYTGKNISSQKELDNEVELRENILEASAQMARAAAVVDEEYKTSRMRAMYEQNGQGAIAWALEGMPVVKPELEIWAVPVFGSGQLTAGQSSAGAASLTAWATLRASEKEFPQPWRMTWEVDGKESVGSVGDRLNLDMGSIEPGRKIQITVSAYDKNNVKIAREFLSIPVLADDRAEKPPEKPLPEKPVKKEDPPPPAPVLPKKQDIPMNSGDEPVLTLTGVQWIPDKDADDNKWITHQQGEPGFRYDWQQDLTAFKKGTKYEGGSLGFVAFPDKIHLGRPFTVTMRATAYVSGITRHDGRFLLRQARLFARVGRHNPKMGTSGTLRGFEAEAMTFEPPRSDYEGPYKHLQELVVTYAFDLAGIKESNTQAIYEYRVMAHEKGKPEQAEAGTLAITWEKENSSLDPARRTSGMTISIGRDHYMNSGQIRLHYTGLDNEGRKILPYVTRNPVIDR